MKRSEISKIVSDTQVVTSEVAAKLLSVAALIEGQCSPSDGMTELFGLGMLVREWAEKLDRGARDLDTLGVALAQTTERK